MYMQAMHVCQWYNQPRSGGKGRKGKRKPVAKWVVLKTRIEGKNPNAA